jgi:hypothetical protein
MTAVRDVEHPMLPLEATDVGAHSLWAVISEGIII